MATFRTRAIVVPLGTAIILASALVGSIAAPVSAANNTVLTTVLGDCGFTGAHAGSKKTVKIEWRDADGALKSKQSVVSSTSGAFTTKCERYEEIESGDTIKTTIGTTSSPVLTIPPLTANIDRISDMITGNTSPNTQIGVELLTYDGAFVPSSDYPSNSVSDPSGNYTFDASTADIMGGDQVALTWQNVRGDRVYRYATAEQLTVWIGRAVVTAYGNPGTNFDLTLRDGANVIAQSGGYVFESENGFYWFDAFGVRVRAAVGNHVHSGFASDADFDLPNITAVINTSTDHVTVDCGLGAGFGIEVVVYARDGTGAASRAGFTGASPVAADFTTAVSHNIVAGDKVDVFCKLPSGDVVARKFTAG